MIIFDGKNYIELSPEEITAMERKGSRRRGKDPTADRKRSQSNAADPAGQFPCSGR